MGIYFPYKLYYNFPQPFFYNHIVSIQYNHIVSLYTYITENTSATACIWRFSLPLPLDLLCLPQSEPTFGLGFAPPAPLTDASPNACHNSQQPSKK